MVWSITTNQSTSLQLTIFNARVALLEKITRLDAHDFLNLKRDEALVVRQPADAGRDAGCISFITAGALAPSLFWILDTK